MRLGNRKFSIAGLVVMLGTIALLASACGTSTSNGPADKAKDQTLKMTWNAGGGKDITGMDPGACYDSSCIQIVDMVFDTLVTLDKDLKVVGWGAKNWAIQDGGKTYVFTLQPNQKFSDGTPVKASDYAWSMDRGMNPCSALTSVGTAGLFLDGPDTGGILDSGKFNGETCKDGVVQGDLTTLVGHSIIPDDSANTLTIKLNAPAPHFLAALNLPFDAAMEKSVIGSPAPADLGADGSWRDNLAKGATGTGGSGMFYVSQWDHNGKLYLKPNPNWWGLSQGKKMNFTAVNFDIFDNTDTLYQTYLSDKSYAFSDGIPAPQRAAAKGKADYKELPALSVETVAFNWNIAPFNDVNARRAFCLALNRDQINTSILKGGSNPSWNLVPPGMPGYNKDIKGIDGAPTAGDTNLAKQYWQKYKDTLGGKPVPPVTLSFNFASNTQKLLAETYQATWKELFPEANVTISQLAWATQVQTFIQHKMQLGRWGWGADYPDPQDFLSILYATNAPYNYFNASDPTADALIKQADAMADPSQAQQRLTLYNQAEQSMVQNVAVCPLYTGITHYRIQTWVKGGFLLNAAAAFPNDSFITGYIANH
jgi:oligopeptide transport system substrate-binding protein